AGACGLVCAIRAADAGLTVGLVEPAPVIGANASLSSGMVYAAATRYQKALGIPDSPEAMSADIVAKNRGECDLDIVNALSHKSAAVVHWLSDRLDFP